MLSQSSAYLYDDRLYLDSRLDKIDTKFGHAINKDDNHFKYTQKQTPSLRNDFIKDIKSDVKLSFDAVERDFNSFKHEVWAELKVIQLDLDEANSMAKNRLTPRLVHPIHGLRASIPGKDGEYLVHPDFPTTVKRFWLLSANREYT